MIAGCAFVLATLAFAGCGGGGGGGSGSSSSVAVNDVTPGTGPFIGGTLVTIEGRSFDLVGANIVKVGGNFATDVVVVDATTLTCRTPAGTPGATVDVIVTNAIGQGRLVNGYTYLSPPPATSDVNGDGIADLIVAAPQDDTVGADGGAVYVFFGSDDPLALQNHTAAQADLKITGHHAGDAFGACVCVGDVNGDDADDLIVGANMADGVGAPEAGAAYVFHGPLLAAPVMSALAADVRLSGETALAGDRFGAPIQVADMDDDGRADVMIGAPLHDAPGQVDAGCVYLFRGGNTLVSKGAESADQAFDGDAANNRMGNSISCGDLNDDGSPDLVLGSQLADPMDPIVLHNAGQVAVLWGGASPHSSVNATVITGVDVGDRFGATVAVADVDGDGIVDLLVGAPLHDTFDVDAGRVYVFLGGATLASGSANGADVVLSGLPTHNSFGRTIRTGDADGDGVLDILVGAPDADYLNDGNGRSYLFPGGPGLTDAVAIDAAAIFNGESSEGDALGSAVSLLDVNGDGFADVACSSSRHGAASGRVYLWMGATTLGGQYEAGNCDVLFSGLEDGSLFGDQLAEGQ